MSARESWYATRTMQAIELLAFQPCTAPQVAAALQVHPRTARRLLNRLVADGYLTRSEGERRVYAPTMRIVALAGQVVERSELTSVAMPVVTRLQEELGGTAHLVVPSYRSALCLVHCAAGGAAAIVRPQLRELVPCHCTAAGKALLAYRDRWRESVLSTPVERHTDRTLIDPADLRRETTRIRQHGYAVEDREYQSDVRAVAAPVFSHDGEAVAALGVSAPASRLPSRRLTAVGERLAGFALELSEALGFRAPAMAGERHG
jgi:DNA-binding IclR family transcriptional regulator